MSCGNAYPTRPCAQTEETWKKQRRPKAQRTAVVLHIFAASAMTTLGQCDTENESKQYILRRHGGARTRKTRTRTQGSGREDESLSPLRAT